MPSGGSCDCSGPWNPANIVEEVSAFARLVEASLVHIKRSANSDTDVLATEGVHLPVLAFFLFDCQFFLFFGGIVFWVLLLGVVFRHSVFLFCIV